MAYPVSSSALPPFEAPVSAKKSTMLALTWQGKNSVVMKPMPVPHLVDPTDALVRVTGTTICGSDLHLLHKALPGMHKNDILGHEFVGTVEEVGDACRDDLGVGQRVVVSFCLSCGECEECKVGHTSQCLRTNPSKTQPLLHGHKLSGFFGYSHLTGGFAGGQAEYVRVPFAKYNCLKIPDELPDEKALFLADVVPTAYHSVVDTLKVLDEHSREGAVWGVWGAGPVGVLVAKFAFLVAKASRVIVVDGDQQRLEHVRNKVEGVETVNFKEVASVPDTIKRITKSPDSKSSSSCSSGGLDVAIDAAGGEYARSWMDNLMLYFNLATDSSETIEECVRCVKPFGTVSIIAEYTYKAHFFPIGALMENGIRLVGSGQTPVHKYWKHLLKEFVLPGRLDPLDLIVTHRFRLEDTARAYELMNKHRYGIIKPFIETKASGTPVEGSPVLTPLV
ncbi:unnamed protein product [Tilletia laevis]|uniref:Alcohol dehydrogenase-like N-terminal domain-containing protein n=2 Tax=Tilletia TaxID=13289 RepID=A0ABN7ILJ0_9BASI|nr:hypothetical protein CF336_g2230 [Tilletia laevis]CAD6893279.1 unnamed protein product [Tilletia caries]CAD6909594.1 unnamed protein product [Tilletia caries]CAD6959241.1 unnamed protein product [Tilletia caries]CAD6962537.1 unnamed protein product [Tilletia laevis]